MTARVGTPLLDVLTAADESLRLDLVKFYRELERLEVRARELTTEGGA